MGSKNVIAWLITLSFLLTACDDGKIYPKEEEDDTGGKATLNVKFKGIDTWPENYFLLFAAIGDNPKVPLMSKVVSMPATENETVSITLNGLADNTTYVTLGIGNKSRQILYDYYTFEIADTGEIYTLPVDEIDLVTYNRIQVQVFEAYCTTCHGEGGAARGLYLTSDRSYNALVNIPSRVLDGEKLLVSPGEPDESFLVDILAEPENKYDHTDILPEAELITLIESWISNGTVDN